MKIVLSMAKYSKLCYELYNSCIIWIVTIYYNIVLSINIQKDISIVAFAYTYIIYI